MPLKLVVCLFPQILCQISKSFLVLDILVPSQVYCPFVLLLKTIHKQVLSPSLHIIMKNPVSCQIELKIISERGLSLPSRWLHQAAPLGTSYHLAIFAQLWTQPLPPFPMSLLTQVYCEELSWKATTTKPKKTKTEKPKHDISHKSDTKNPNVPWLRPFGV